MDPEALGWQYEGQIAVAGLARSTHSHPSRAPQVATPPRVQAQGTRRRHCPVDVTAQQFARAPLGDHVLGYRPKHQHT